MSQTERADYDDNLFAPKSIRNPHLCRRAGKLWIRTWLCFLVGIIAMFGYSFLKSEKATQLIWFSAHLVITALVILGALSTRKGNGTLLLPISIVSVLVGIIYGGTGFLVGLLYLYGFEDGSLFSKIVGGVTMVCSVGFAGYGCVSIYWSIQYAIQRSHFADPKIRFNYRPPSPTHGAPNDVAN